MLLSHFTIEKDPDAIFWIDSEDTLYRVNEATCRLVGYDLEELVGKKIEEIAVGVASSTINEYRQHLKQYGSLKVELSIFAKDGREIPEDDGLFAKQNTSVAMR